jgi:tetratricopeptide (TPR) repeat protein
LGFSASKINAQESIECSVEKTALEGHVRDARGSAVANASVVLQFGERASGASTKAPRYTHSNATGSFCFRDLPEGRYNLRATLNGFRDSASAAVDFRPNNGMTVDLRLVKMDALSTEEPESHTNAIQSISKAPEFFDQPQFEVAGVTQAGSGGHGADTVGRSTETLAEKMKSLATETSTTEPADLDAKRKTLAATLAREPNNAEAHRLLGDVLEKSNDPLKAVREYQRATEIDPNEPNLFSWGMELLVHRALEPATEVLAKGNRLYPKSERTLLALGITWYARAFYDRAAQALETACDLNSGNSSPYLFLGEVEAAQVALLPGAMERLARFAQLEPENALANYYYAMSLRKRLVSQKAVDTPNADLSSEHASIESLFKKAIRIDPQLGAAHLQLGIFYSDRGDSAAAMREYQSAISVASDDKDILADSHYRLAQAYVRSGDRAKADEEFRLHRDLAKQNADNSARERQKLQQFVISLRSDGSKNPDASARH